MMMKVTRKKKENDGDDEDTPQDDAGHSNTEGIRLTGLDADMKERIHRMRAFADEKKGVYYITQFPSDLQFGKDLAFNMSNFLVRRDNMPVVAWVLGRIVKCNLLDDHGDPRPSAFVSIQCLADADAQMSAKIMNMYSNPKQHFETDLYKRIGAGKMGTKYGSDRPPDLFKSVYLATETMAAKAKMAKFDPTRLKRGDLVMLEIRVKKKFDPNAPGDIPKQDQEHTIVYQLQSVYFLRSGSDDDVVDDEDFTDPLGF